jgi:hypothetical protein
VTARREPPRNRSLEWRWRGFFVSFVSVAFGVSGGLYLLALMIDPYDSVPFSPPADRYPVTAHVRYYNASLASSGRFDSAVVGSSTAMLLQPKELEAVFGGRFVSLAMPAASPYEQRRVLDLLSYTGTYDRTLIIGLDPSWCAPDGSPRLLQQMAGLTFPEALYDDIHWNDLPGFNRKTLQHARSQVLALLGLRVRHPRRPDGYRDFTLTFRTDHTPEAVRGRIYGESPWLLQRGGVEGPPRFPEIDALAERLSQLPDRARKIAFFVPFHVRHQVRDDGEQQRFWSACKEKASDVLGEVPNTLVLDFMIPSPITTEDLNYVDGQHYTTAVATDIARLLHAGADRPSERAEAYRVLADAGRPR